MSKWIQCKKCKQEYDNNQSHCPQCRRLTPNFANNSMISVISVLMCAILVWAVSLMLPEKKDEIQVLNSSENQRIDSESSSNSSDTSSAVPSSSSSSPVAPPVSSSSKETTSQVKSEKIVDKLDGAVSGDKYGEVFVKMPKWMLLLVEPNYDYKPTAEEKKLGMTGVTKNADGSATFTFDSANSHNKLVLTSKTNANTACSSFKSQHSYVTKVDYRDDYSIVDVYTTLESSDQIDEEFSIHLLMAGTMISYSQQIDINVKLGSVIKIYGKNSELIAVSDYPQTAIDIFEKKNQ